MTRRKTPPWEEYTRLPAMRHGSADPAFSAPWQAAAFAMTLALHERGLFTWAEWTVHLSSAIRDAQATGDPDRGDTYYEHWLTALERIVTEKGYVTVDALLQRRDAWDEAARRTPHGVPIELR
ncbi:nitrile hydratase accessory protein [Burkholderia sp. MR1-5-21]